MSGLALATLVHERTGSPLLTAVSLFGGRLRRRPGLDDAHERRRRHAPAAGPGPAGRPCPRSGPPSRPCPGLPVGWRLVPGARRRLRAVHRRRAALGPAQRRRPARGLRAGPVGHERRRRRDADRRATARAACSCSGSHRTRSSSPPPSSSGVSVGGPAAGAARSARPGRPPRRGSAAPGRSTGCCGRTARTRDAVSRHVGAQRAGGGLRGAVRARTPASRPATSYVAGAAGMLAVRRRSRAVRAGPPARRPHDAAAGAPGRALPGLPPAAGPARWRSPWSPWRPWASAPA